MKLIIKRNLLNSLIYLAAALAIVIIVKILSASSGNAYFVMVGAVLNYFLVMGIVFISEQYEDKHKGYALLASLPVRIRDVVAVKFILVLLNLALFTAFLVILSKLFISKENYGLVKSFFLLNGSTALLLGGLFYLGIYALGYTKFTVVFLSFTVAAGFVPMAIRMFADFDALMDQFQQFLRTFPWGWAAPLVFLCFLVLLYGAVYFKEQRIA